MDYKRFERQLILPEIGLIGQQKLAAARVLVVGAGGLGCPALLYLAAAGVGTIGIVDFDVVALANLNRQVLFGVADVNKSKAKTAAKTLSAAYPDLTITAYAEKIRPENADALLAKYDVVLDASDNFATRYLLNDACALLQKPLVYGAVYRYEGQVAVFHASAGQAANYRDLFPEIPAPTQIPTCSEAGVLGVVPGIIGTMQAGEAIKLLAGIGKPLTQHVLTYNFLEQSFFSVRIPPNHTARKAMPNSIEALKILDYEWLCHEKTANQ